MREEQAADPRADEAAEETSEERMALHESGLVVIRRAARALRRGAALDCLAAIGRVSTRAQAPLARIAHAAAAAPRGGAGTRLGQARRQHHQGAKQRKQQGTP